MSPRPTPDLAGPGQESVWDYPRPPALERTDALVVVRLAGTTIAETRRAFRVLETSHPPSYYLPPDDIDRTFVNDVPGTTFCEWKGRASYVDVEVAGERAQRAGWYYPVPNVRYADLAGHVSFYPSRVECYVDGERVRSVPGGFYGGWVTDDVVGPFKGAPGTEWW